MTVPLVEDTIPIMFSAGSYGTFVAWTLSYFSGQTDIIPFNKLTGSSHQFITVHVGGIEDWRTYKSGTNYQKIIRVHPKFAHEDIVNNIVEIANTTNKAILLDGTTNIASVINNKFTKIHANGWIAAQGNKVQDNIVKWGKQNYNDMLPWEQREFLSIYLIPQHLSEIGYYELKDFAHPKVKIVNISELFTDFEATVKMLLDYCELPLIRDNFAEIYSMWRPLQVHANKDALIASIVNAIQTSQYLSWADTPLSLVDEAIVQMQLRNLHNLDMLCYNVNEFPTNTIDLKKILING